MTQDKYMINGVEIWQPDAGLQFSWEPTYREDASRSYTGSMHATPLFSVEQYAYKATNVPEADARFLINAVCRGAPFDFHYFSAPLGVWRDGQFRVGKGSASIGCLDLDTMTYDEISFNMTGEEPIGS